MAETKKKTLAEQINFSGKGKTKQRKKQRKKFFNMISKKFGFGSDEDKKKKE